MTNSIPLSEKLRDLRISFKMTQDDIASVLEMSRTSFSKYENGASNPPLSVMRKLAAIYNVKLEYLIYDDLTVVEFNNAKTPNEFDADSVEIPFSDLSHDEKLIIMKTRIMSAKQKEEFIELLKKISEETNE